MAATRQAPAIGGRGLLLVLVGALSVLASFRSLRHLDWYAVSGTAADSAPEATFANLRHSVDQFGGARAAEIYFDYLAYALLIAVIVFGALANVESRFTGLMRVLGFVTGAAGVGATYYALLQYADAQADAGAALHNPLYNGSWGLFAVLLGFTLAGIGAVLGPRRDA